MNSFFFGKCQKFVIDFLFFSLVYTMFFFVCVKELFTLCYFHLFIRISNHILTLIIALGFMGVIIFLHFLSLPFYLFLWFTLKVISHTSSNADKRNWKPKTKYFSNDNDKLYSFWLHWMWQITDVSQWSF